MTDDGTQLVSKEKVKEMIDRPSTVQARKRNAIETSESLLLFLVLEPVVKVFMR
jgi:hypothetical protein